MADRITIRRPRADEQDRLFAIWAAAVDATHHFLLPEDRAFFAGLVRDAYLPQATLWVAAGEEPLGFLGIDGRSVEALFVDPAHHGKGIGRALLARAMEAGRPLTVDVNEQNEGARRFYERSGFRVVGRSPLDGTGRPYPLLHMVMD